MPKFAGLFDQFDNLDQTNIENVASWLKRPPQLITLENYIANKILYPQTLPLTSDDMKIDLAILREVLKLTLVHTQNGNALLGENPFFNPVLRKILIPRKFLNYVPDLARLTWTFVDILPLAEKRKDFFEDLWTIVLTNDSDEVIGSLLIPQFGSPSSQMEIKIADNPFKVKAGSLVVIPCSKERCGISYKFSQGKILGKTENSVEVFGGRLGIMIDGRKR